MKTIEETVRIGRKVITIFILLFLFFNLSCSENDILLNKEKAQNKLSEAISKLNKLGGIASFEGTENQPSFPQSDVNRLTADQIYQTLNEVIKDLKEALKLNPELKEAYYYLGVAYTKLQDRKHSVEALEKSITFEPTRELSYIILCNLLWDEGNYKEAYRVSSKYLEQFPDRKIKGLLLIGTTYYKQGDFRNAIEKGKEIVSSDKRSVEGHLLLATSYYHLGNKESSEKEFNKILEIDPKWANTIEKMKEKLK